MIYIHMTDVDILCQWPQLCQVFIYKMDFHHENVERYQKRLADDYYNRLAKRRQAKRRRGRKTVASRNNPNIHPSSTSPGDCTTSHHNCGANSIDARSALRSAGGLPSSSSPTPDLPIVDYKETECMCETHHFCLSLTNRIFS